MSKCLPFNKTRKVTYGLGDLDQLLVSNVVLDAVTKRTHHLNTENKIRKWIKQFFDIGNVSKEKSTGRPDISDDCIWGYLKGGLEGAGQYRGIQGVQIWHH